MPVSREVIQSTDMCAKMPCNTPPRKLLLGVALGFFVCSMPSSLVAQASSQPAQTGASNTDAGTAPPCSASSSPTSSFYISGRYCRYPTGGRRSRRPLPAYAPCLPIRLQAPGRRCDDQPASCEGALRVRSTPAAWLFRSCADNPQGHPVGRSDRVRRHRGGRRSFYRTEHFRSGASFQTTFQTSSDNLLGGVTTTIKPAWGFTGVLSDRLELTSAFYYKQSVHTVRGTPAKQFEPDITLNARVRKATWFLEWDSYYDFIPQQFAQTMKAGVSRRLGAAHRWVASAYYSLPINAYGRTSQYKCNTGLDVTWYPFRNR